MRRTSADFSREREVVKEARRLRVDKEPYGVGPLTLDTLVADWAPYDHRSSAVWPIWNSVLGNQ
jgi:hypothetical protein